MPIRSLALTPQNYDVSAVDAQNVPVAIVPSAKSCTQASCPVDIAAEHSCFDPSLQVKDASGKIISCLTDCTAAMNKGDTSNSVRRSPVIGADGTAHLLHGQVCQRRASAGARNLADQAAPGVPLERRAPLCANRDDSSLMLQTSNGRTPAPSHVRYMSLADPLTFLDAYACAPTRCCDDR